MSVVSVILAIFALGLLIIVHEGGHYLVAKWSGMRVERFSLGFGPALVKWQRKGTQFQIAPIPFGGFVQITGMNPHEEFDPEDPAVYPNRPTILRFLTIFAGPATNLLFSIFFVFAVLAFAGYETYSGHNQISEVSKGQPAEGNLEVGDIVLRVNGEEIFFDKTEAFRDRIQKAEGKPVALIVKRGDKEIPIEVTPKQRKDSSWGIGVRLEGDTRVREKPPLGEAIVASFKYPVVKSGEILSGLWAVVTGKAPADAGGPVMITKMIGESIRAGWARAFEFLALLNVYLGLFNLLPLPALDGGRLVFLGYELATRRRPNPKVEAAVHMAGFLVLLVLMLLVTFKDIRNLF